MRTGPTSSIPAAPSSTDRSANAAALTYSKTYTLDPRDQVTQVAVTGGSAPGTTTYTYDADGNLKTKTGPTANRTFVWSVRDRLVEVQDAGATIAQYRYNAEGLRDEIVGERRTTWVNGFAYLDKAPDNTFLAKYETHPNGRSPVVALTPSGTEYEQIDALGSTTLSTNSAGGTNATTTYDAFGNSITTGSTVNKFGYTGHETDRSTGLVYFKARHYDPELGRFISADPYEGEPNYPVTWNDYLYANGNPLIYIDENGYESVSTMIDNGAEGCKGLGCAGWALLKGVYQVSTLGFASVHDPARDAYDQGKISTGQYVGGGIGGGLVVAGVSLLTARAGGELIGAGIGAAIKGGAALGAASASITDVATQSAEIATGQRETYSGTEALGAAGVGGATGAVLGGVGAKAAQIDAAREVAKREASEIQTRARELSIGRDDAPFGLKADPPASGTGAVTAPKLTPDTPVMSGESSKMGQGLGLNESLVPKSVAATNKVETLDTIPEGRRIMLAPVEIRFPAKGLSSAQQSDFSFNLSEQEFALNRLSLSRPSDLELNLANYRNIKPLVAQSRKSARGYLSGSGEGLDAAHRLDTVAGGYTYEFAGFRSPIQRQIGALWRTRAKQIIPGREHRLVPDFGE